MKINREAKQSAKTLYRACLRNGVLDEALVKQVFSLLAEKKPRGYFAIMHRLKKLVALEVHRRTARVESATPLGDSLEPIVAQLRSLSSGSLASVDVSVNPALIGGVRLQLGSNVWDGSVKGRLDALSLAFN